jgi:hypothetical protein
MKATRYILFLLLSLLVLLQSCGIHSFEKRRYNRGFYIDRSHVDPVRTLSFTATSEIESVHAGHSGSVTESAITHPGSEVTHNAVFPNINPP